MTPPTSTQQKAAHTPTPYQWHRFKRVQSKLLSEIGTGKYDVCIQGDGITIAFVCGDEAKISGSVEATAAFIVRACNSHEALAKALNNAISMIVNMSDSLPMSPADLSRVNKLRETLRQATA